MKRLLKTIGYIFLILLVLSGSLFIYAYQNIDKLKKYALEEVNKNLNARLDAKSIDVTVVAAFPKVSLALNQVTVSDPLRKGKKLASLRNVFLGFDLFDVIREKYDIQLISLDSGYISMFVDPVGRQNFDILKKNDSPNLKKSEAFAFRLSKVTLNKVRVGFENRKNPFTADVYSESTEFSGNFSSEKFDLNINLSGFSNEFKSGSLIYLKEKTLHVKTIVEVNLTTGIYSVKEGEFSINALLLQLKGSVSQSKKGNQFDLSFRANKITIQDLLSTLPFQLPEAFNKYSSQGKVYFDGTVKGVQNQEIMPEISLNFGIENGTLTEPESNIKVDRINLTGNFSNGEKRNLSSSSVKISNLNAELPGSKVKGNLVISNFESPQLFAELTGEADLAGISSFLHSPDVEKAEGKARFTVTLSGKKAGDSWDWTSPMNKGFIEASVSTFKLSYIKKAFEQVELKASIDGSELVISDLMMKVGKSDFSVHGNLPGFVSYFSDQNKTLTGNLTVRCKELNSEDLLIYNSSDPHEEGEKPLDYNLRIEFNSGKLQFNKWAATMVNCQASITPENIGISYFSLNTCGGIFSGEATFQSRNNGYILKSGNQISGIQIQELFRQFEEFGQNEITSSNLKGIMKARTDLIVVFDKNMNLLKEKLILVSDMEIKNGELVNYEPLTGMSGFVDVNELKNLKFSELKNTISIKNSCIYIPEMEIKNNAINLNVSGKHTFDNEVNYKIKLSLSELLAKKRKPRPNEFGEENEKTRGLNLYLTISGHINDLKYTFDRKSVGEKLKQDVKAEKESIKEIIRQELNIKKDSSLKKVEKNNDNNDELEFEQD